MDKRIKKRWIAALRSRKYKRGEGLLRQVGHTKRQVDRFCCLGVLCELAVRSKVIKAPKLRYDGMGYYYDGKDTVLPEAVVNWAGITNSVGAFAQTDLAKLNDSGLPFNKIANYIEKYF